jgi:aminoglycoside phosphotransferase (APT) family kinase protein
MVILDPFLTLRRDKPRPLSLVHGDFNPANFLYEEPKVTALIDWAQARIGDPREDLGWMTTIDILSNTHVMDHRLDEGGFLAQYDKLTGFDITQDEVDYFTLYMVQAAGGTMPNLLRLLDYPGVPQ